MNKKTKFELITPSKTLVDQDVEMVVIPGAEGYFGVLPLHAPTLSALQSGIVSIYEDNKIISKTIIDGGIACVQPEGCYLLVERAESIDKIDKTDLENRLGKADKTFHNSNDEIEKAVALKEKNWVTFMINLI